MQPATRFKVVDEEQSDPGEATLGAEPTDAYAIFPTDTGEFDLEPALESESWAAIENALLERSEVAEDAAKELRENRAVICHTVHLQTGRSLLLALDGDEPLVVEDRPMGADQEHREIEALVADALALLGVIHEKTSATLVGLQGREATVVVVDGKWVNVSLHPATRIGIVVQSVEQLAKGHE